MSQGLPERSPAYLGVGDSLWSHKDFAMLITPRIPNSLEYFSPDKPEDQDVLRVYINNKRQQVVANLTLPCFWFVQIIEEITLWVGLVGKSGDLSLSISK